MEDLELRGLRWHLALGVANPQDRHTALRVRVDGSHLGVILTRDEATAMQTWLNEFLR